MTNLHTAVVGPRTAAGDPLRLLAAVLARPRLDNGAKLVFCSLLCDEGFRQGWIVTKPSATFAADLSIATVEDLHRYVEALVADGLVDAQPNGGLLGLGLGPTAARLLWEE